MAVKRYYGEGLVWISEAPIAAVEPIDAEA